MAGVSRHSDRSAPPPPPGQPGAWEAFIADPVGYAKTHRHTLATTRLRAKTDAKKVA